MTEVGTRTPSRVFRAETYGIDIADGLEWKGGTWSSGGEYIKRFIVKNVTTKVQKIKYSLPKSKFFYMEFPDQIRLSPGMAMPLEVRFRPIRMEEYDDYVEFHTENGSFKVFVRARLAALSVELADNLDFGHCPVNEVSQQSFRFENTGEVPARFSIRVDAPFEILPREGTIPPKTGFTMHASYSPGTAAIMRSQAVVSVNDGAIIRKISILAISKYPHILASQDVVDFGTVLVGTTGEKS